MLNYWTTKFNTEDGYSSVILPDTTSQQLQSLLTDCPFQFKLYAWMSPSDSLEDMAFYNLKSFPKSSKPCEAVIKTENNSNGVIVSIFITYLTHKIK